MEKNEKELIDRLHFLINRILNSNIELNELLNSIKKIDNHENNGSMIIKKLLELSDKSSITRIVEDLINVLIEKNVIEESDLDNVVIKKLNIRKELRNKIREINEN